MAEPSVSGKRIIIAAYRKTIVLGTFSSHKAAIVAYVLMLRMVNTGGSDHWSEQWFLGSDRAKLSQARVNLANYRATHRTSRRS